jgi:hypothetical protein
VFIRKKDILHSVPKKWDILGLKSLVEFYLKCRKIFCHDVVSNFVSVCLRVMIIWWGLLWTGTNIQTFKHTVILCQAWYLLNILLSQWSVFTIYFFYLPWLVSNRDSQNTSLTQLNTIAWLFYSHNVYKLNLSMQRIKILSNFERITTCIIQCSIFPLEANLSVCEQNRFMCVTCKSCESKFRHAVFGDPGSYCSFCRWDLWGNECKILTCLKEVS